MNTVLLGFLTTTCAYFVYYAVTGNTELLLRQAVLISIACTIGMAWRIYKYKKSIGK